ncbi:MAG: hypothetical protein WCE90_04565 [Candidatus Zixiibacteriota bacterium]
MNDIISKLLNSNEPSVRYKVLVNVLGEKCESSKTMKLQEAIKSSPRVKLLLPERGKNGKIPHHPYRKWYGAHWVLATLADIGYPVGDKLLIPLREQVLDWLFSEEHQKKIRVMNGRTRRCASQEGNALFSLLTLGLSDDRTEKLAERLIEWQWPDGGWNCDKDPQASKSSFWESLIPLRALSLHARLTGSKKSRKAAERASEVFLKRKLFRRQKDGRAMNADFLKLHYPCYWRYDILFGLKVMAEAGFIGDKRCRDALDVLESKRLPDGGFPAEAKFYRVSKESSSGCSRVSWGATGKRRMNEFVTSDALFVLKKVGRLSL